MTQPALYIVVVLYNSADAFSALWPCLAAQTCRDWRLVAIDNASADGSAAGLRALEDPRVTVIENGRNLGFARAVNQGLRTAINQGAQRCMLLNPDTVLPPDFLGELLDAWQRHGWQVVAPRIMRTGDPARSWYAGGYLEYGWAFANRHDDYSPDDTPFPREVDFASGCCLGLSAAVLREVGLLDESFFVYWEDTDYCLRLKAAGIPVTYIRDPMLLHEGGASSGGESSPAATRLFYTSYALLLRKHFGLRQAWQMSFRAFRRERARPGEQPGHARRVAGALWRGLWTPLRPEPRLPDVDASGPPSGASGTLEGQGTPDEHREMVGAVGFEPTTR